jgi:hypothetical protein
MDGNAASQPINKSSLPYQPKNNRSCSCCKEWEIRSYLSALDALQVLYAARGVSGQGLVGRLRRSIFFFGVERYGSAFFFLVSTAILSRLLEAEDFGV